MWHQFISFFVLSLSSLDRNVYALNTLQPFSTMKQKANNRNCVVRKSNKYLSNFSEPCHISRQSSMTLSLTPSSFFRPLNADVTDSAAVVCGCLILALYHLRLYLIEARGVRRTWRTVQADNRQQWSKFVRETEGWLYAVQTLRNAITAQTFLSTTVITLLTVITGRLWEIIRNLDTKSNYQQYLIAQLVMVAATMMTSAYHFLQSARLMTHAGFMFPIDSKTTKVDMIMRKTQNAQWLGLRWLYLSVAMISWVVGGGRTLFLSSVLLTIFFRNIDKVPEGVDADANCVV